MNGGKKAYRRNPYSSCESFEQSAFGIPQQKGCHRRRFPRPTAATHLAARTLAWSSSCSFCRSGTRTIQEARLLRRCPSRLSRLCNRERRRERSILKKNARNQDVEEEEECSGEIGLIKLVVQQRDGERVCFWKEDDRSKERTAKTKQKKWKNQKKRRNNNMMQYCEMFERMRERGFGM